MADFPQLPQLPQFPPLTGKRIAGIIGILIVFVIILDGLVSVPPGHVGIIFDRGRGVLMEELPEGLHFKIPFWQVSTLMDVRIQEYTMSAVPGEGVIYSDDSMTAPTLDGQTVTVDATVLFYPDPDKAAEIFQTIGPDYIEKIVRTISRSQIRAVIANYSAIDVYAVKRDEAEEKINDVIRDLFRDKNIVLDSVLLRHIAFSPQFANAIEEKKIATEQRIQAEELKRKKIIEAEAEAESIRLKGEMLRLNPLVIQFEFVQKMSPSINWGILPDNILPLLNLGSR